MKEFKTFIVCILCFFSSWIAISYLFAGTIVLVSGFSESFYPALTYPVVYCISFIGSLIGAGILADNYYSHLKSKRNG